MPSLTALIESDIEVIAVVTNPDRPSGRGMQLTGSPVKEVAHQAGLALLQPERARDPELHDRLRSMDPDVATVVAYGKILPGSLLEVPQKGFVNLHFSLLPQYRGAAPVQRAIMDGCSVTGVSTMVLTEGMDEGPVLEQRREPIGPQDTTGTLGERLARLGAGVLVHSLKGYVEGSIRATDQDHSSATYAPKITEEEARIDWGAASEVVANHIRGLNPAPGAWTTLRNKRVKIWMARVEGQGPGLDPGSVSAAEGLLVGTGTTPLSVEQAQVEGRRRMTGTELARGLRLADDDLFE